MRFEIRDIETGALKGYVHEERKLSAAKFLKEPVVLCREDIEITGRKQTKAKK